MKSENRVFVKSMRGKALMPTSNRKARILLKQGKAKIVCYNPFTIQLNYPTGETTQPIKLGIEPNYNDVGIAVVSQEKVLHKSEIHFLPGMRTNLKSKSALRKARRGRKTRYRKHRCSNRASRFQTMTPSSRNKLRHYIKWINKFKALLPNCTVYIVCADPLEQTTPESNESITPINRKPFRNVRIHVFERDGTSFPTTAVDTKVPSTLLVKTALAGKQATLTTGTGIDITSNTIKNTGVTAVGVSAANGSISVTTNGTTADVAVHGLNNAAYKDVDTTINTSSPSDKLPTSAAVQTAINSAINTLPEPMVFKGTVSGTYPATPSVGDTYKATANSNSGVTPAYKAGDTVIYSEPSTGTFEWVVIPSGDEPSGTVTGITGADGVITTNDTTGSSTISTSGTVKLSLVSTHTTTINAGAATSTANRSYPLAIDGNSKLAVNVPWENTTYANGSGITIGSGNAINHSNSVTASGDTVAALKVKYDAQGHITGSAALAASDIGLGNVGNFKAVSTSASQGLTPTEQQDARNNINIASSATTIKSATTNNTVVNGFSTSSVSGKNLYTYDSVNERLTFNFLSYSTGDAVGTTDVSVYAVNT